MKIVLVLFLYFLVSVFGAAVYALVRHFFQPKVKQVVPIPHVDFVKWLNDWKEMGRPQLKVWHPADEMSNAQKTHYIQSYGERYYPKSDNPFESESYPPTEPGRKY